MRFDFETWLLQNYGIKVKDLGKDELVLARKEYEEEYPPPGESDIRPKTYPFKAYLDGRR